MGEKNNTNTRNSLVITIIGTISLVAVVFSCWVILGDAMSDKREERTNIFYHYYNIEPTSLLEALEAGNINVFSPIDEEPPLIPPNQQVHVPWTQQDYFRIVNALFLFSRGDTMEGWKLNRMDFDLDCSKFGLGFQDGNFRFFKIVNIRERESRIVRIVNIDPRNKFVFITENEYYPMLAKWSAINFGQYSLSADMILQIADNASGWKKRQSVENACDISLFLYPDYASYNGWKVSYYRKDDGKSFYHIEIDPITGKTH